MNDLRILFSNQPPFVQAVAVAEILCFTVAALGVILTLRDVFGHLVRWVRHVRARRYFDQVVRIERHDRRRRELNAVSRSGGRS